VLALLLAGAAIIVINVVVGRLSRPGLDAVGAYRAALRRLHDSPQVVESLGQPIVADAFWEVQISITERDGQTVAQLDSPIRGPRGTGRIDFVAVGHRRQWQFERLIVRIDGRAEPIVIEPEE